MSGPNIQFVVIRNAYLMGGVKGPHKETLAIEVVL